MRKNLSGKQVLSLLEIHAENNAYKSWVSDKGMALREYFFKDIWLKNTWTNWYFTGMISGCNFMLFKNELENDADRLGEYQCIQYHFCLQEESNYHDR